MARTLVAAGSAASSPLCCGSQEDLEEIGSAGEAVVNSLLLMLTEVPEPPSPALPAEQQQQQQEREGGEGADAGQLAERLAALEAQVEEAGGRLTEALRRVGLQAEA
jgi:hypothetical protein